MLHRKAFPLTLAIEALALSVLSMTTITASVAL